MATSDAQLIERLQQRKADREIATDGGMHPRKAVRCVTKQRLLATEKALGFALPDIARSLYLQVGNGGFGPQYRIAGIQDGAKLEGHTLETCYQQNLNLAKECSIWRWPPMLLPLASLGCGMWTCVDCTYVRLPMMLWDPNPLDSDLEADDARLNWGNSFWDQRLSLKTWLNDWLDCIDEPEPQWPTDSWARKRLGYKLPR